eukprot:4478569-Pleurochrysis_carterae.AAC.8
MCRGQVEVMMPSYLHGPLPTRPKSTAPRTFSLLECAARAVTNGQAPENGPRHGSSAARIAAFGIDELLLTSDVNEYRLLRPTGAQSERAAVDKSKRIDDLASFEARARAISSQARRAFGLNGTQS